MTGGIETRGGRRLFAVSMVLSALGVALGAWWLFSLPPRPWWILAAGLLVAFAGVAFGARARRDEAAALENDPPERGGR